MNIYKLQSGSMKISHPVPAFAASQVLAFARKLIVAEQALLRRLDYLDLCLICNVPLVSSSVKV